MNDFNRFGARLQGLRAGRWRVPGQTEDLRLFMVKSERGEMVPLSTLVTMKATSGPEVTNRFNLYRPPRSMGCRLKATARRMP